MKTVRQFITSSHKEKVSSSLGSPKQVKILDFQALTLGHPAVDIWSMVYSATDPEYRAASLEADLKAYFTVLATYMEEADPDFTEFMQEVEERRVYGLVLFSELLADYPSIIYIYRYTQTLFRLFMFRISEPDSASQSDHRGIQVH